MSVNLVIPPATEGVIQGFEEAEAPFTVANVQKALATARSELQNPTEEENLGAWSEVLAFTLVGDRSDSGPWRTYFVPMGSVTDQHGQLFYKPDIADANADVIAHWADRTNSINHPVLRARYADLVWEMAPTIVPKSRRDPEMARIAIDAYLASVETSVLPELYDWFEATLRALDLACLIRDQERVGLARKVLMRLHREAIKAREGLWWLAYDRLIDEKNAGVTDEERQELVSSLEELVLYFGDTSDPKKFNPHFVKDAATRLVRHFTRCREYGEVNRLQAAIGRTFEHEAGLANAMAGSSFLRTAVNAYREAGLREDSERARLEMQEAIRRSGEQRQTIKTEIEIPREDIEKFCAAVVTDDLGATFAQLAAQFLPSRAEDEKQVQETKKVAPLSAHIPQHIMADDHVVAKVGSIDSDLLGRTLQQTGFFLGVTDVWLEQALIRLFEVHSVDPEHFAGWANRLGIFEDTTFLLDGILAWHQGDLVKALHVLVPQVETGLRGIVSQLGKPVTKDHRTVEGVSVPLTMGDILYDEELSEALGPDLTYYFLAFYADPRGMNIRNRVAHGLIKPERVSPTLVRLLIHTLLVFGVWKELAEERR